MWWLFQNSTFTHSKIHIFKEITDFNLKEHPDKNTNVIIISLQLSVANSLEREDQIQIYTFIENIGVPQGIVCGHPCLLTFTKRNIQYGLAMYR